MFIVTEFGASYVAVKRVLSLLIWVKGCERRRFMTVCYRMIWRDEEEATQFLALLARPRVVHSGKEFGMTG